MGLKILHSSDWHLGKRLYHKSREPEFRLFLDWLLEHLQNIDLLLISGDVFDTNTPPVWAQELYYQFLHQATQVCEVVVIAGNHDSAIFLEAPRALLKAMRVHVVGNPSLTLQEKVQTYLQAEQRSDSQAEQRSDSQAEQRSDSQAEQRSDSQSDSPTRNDTESSAPLPELITIYKSDSSGELLCLVCALPYLRDSYLRKSSWEQKEEKLQQGIAAYYQVLCQQAERFLETQNLCVPIIATGHLFASGASTLEDDGVRELYIGSLGHFQTELFPKGFDYIALGHIHQAQKLKSPAPEQQIRYSGAPLAFTFGERKKIILQLDFETNSQNSPEANFNDRPNKYTVEEVEVPEWQPLAQIKGNAEELENGMQTLAAQNSEQKMGQKTWLELEHTGNLSETPGLRERLTELAEQHNMEILRYRTQLNAQTHSLSRMDSENREVQAEMLSELTPEEVFRERLRQQDLSNAQEAKKIKNPEAPEAPELEETEFSEETKTPKDPEEKVQNEDLWQLYRSLLNEIALQQENPSEVAASQATASLSAKVANSKETEVL